MNERINELRKQVKVDMHLHNVEDIKAMEGCFGFEGGNKIVNDYIEKFAELIVAECNKAVLEVPCYYKDYRSQIEESVINDCARALLEHFGVEL